MGRAHQTAKTSVEKAFGFVDGLRLVEIPPALL
jgi:hypothetical protein